MTDFLGDVLGVVASALDGLCHQQHVRRVVPRHSALILQVTDKDQVAAPVDLRIGAQHPDGAVQILKRKGLIDLEQHLLQCRSHPGQVFHVFGRDLRADSAHSSHERPQQVTDAFQVDHEFQAGEQLARFRL